MEIASQQQWLSMKEQKLLAIAHYTSVLYHKFIKHFYAM
jgi:hypothetical protein